MGRFIYLINLSIFLLLFVLLNTYAFTIPPPYSVQNYHPGKLNNISECCDKNAGGICQTENRTECCKEGFIPIVDHTTAKEIYGLKNQTEKLCYRQVLDKETLH
jgi:hypothetical protein